MSGIQAREEVEEQKAKLKFDSIIRARIGNSAELYSVFFQ